MSFFPLTDHHPLVEPIMGIVEQGRQQARKFGFPTANVGLKENISLSPGVYCGQAEIDGKVYAAMGYLDPCNPQILEVHLFNFKGDLYSKTLKVSLTRFVRYPMNFEDDEMAKAQIRKDATLCLKDSNAS